MQIGELSEQTSASVRSLRYYEQQGLLTSTRRSNGYREYPEHAVAVVKTIQSLLEIGLPTTLIRQVLPCSVGDRTESACPALLEQVAVLRAEVRSKADRLDTIEKSLGAYLEQNASVGAA